MNRMRLFGAAAVSVITGAAFLLLFVVPFLRLGLLAFLRDGVLVTDNLAVLAPGGSDARALANSLKVATVATVLAIAVAIVFAWLLERTDVPGRLLLSWALVLPYFIPPFVTAFAWTRLLGPIGYYNRWLMTLFHLEMAPVTIYGAGGVIAVSAIYGFPFAFLILRKAIQNADGSLEEAARISGASVLHSAGTVTLQTLIPSIGAAAVIVFVTTVSMFGIPAILGVPGRFIVLTTRIYAYIGSFGNRYGLNIAASLSLVLLAVGIAGLWLQQYLIRHERYVTVTGKAVKAAPVRLGLLRWPVALSMWAVVILGVFGPVLALLATALTRALGVPLSWSNLTGSNFVRVLTQMPVVLRSARTSILLAVTIASMTSVAAVAVVFLRRYARSHSARKIGQFFDLVMSMPYAVPGMVIGIAMIVMWIRPVLGIRIYNTWWILAVAYLARFMIFPLRSVDAAARAIDPSLVESAQLAGAGPSRIGRDILAPIIRPSVLSGWILVFMPALTELTLSVLLYSPGNETIGVTAYNIIQEGLLPVAAALSIIIILLVVGVDLVIRRLGYQA